MKNAAIAAVLVIAAVSVVPTFTNAATIFSDGFENPSTFSAWTHVDNDWHQENDDHSGLYSAEVNDAGSDELRKDIPTVGYENLILSYWFKIPGGLSSSDELRVQWWDGTAWYELINYDGTPTISNWMFASIPLWPTASNNPNFKLRFLAESLDNAGDKFRLDDVMLAGTAANVAPTLNAIADQTVDELALLTVTTIATDGNGDTLSYAIHAGAVSGMAISGSGVFTWTPTEAQGPGTYPVTIRVSDGHTGHADRAFTITVNEVNIAPTAADQLTSTHVNVPQTITLGATDADLPAQTLTFAIVTPPAHGTLGAITGDQVTYTPDTDYTGADSFTFTAGDGTAQSNTATVSIVVDNGAPTLGAITDKIVDELAALTFTLVGTDADGDTLTFGLTGLPAGASFDTGTGAFSWTPTEAQGYGLYSLTATVTDGVSTASQPFTITVNEVNAAPIAAEQSVTTVEDTVYAGTVAAADADIPVQALTYATTSDPAHGTLVFGTDGSFTYAPAADYFGPDAFAFTAHDGVAASTPATITITVTPVNDAPEITLNGDATINLVVGDTFTDQGATGTDVEDGTLPVSTTGTVSTTTPGTYTITYTVTDENEQSASVTRTVIVTAEPVENTEQLCTDDVDNDHDELTDLADPDCAAFIPDEEPQPEPEPQPTPSAPQGGGTNGPIMGSFGSIGTIGVGSGQVLGASTSTGAAQSCEPLLSGYLRLGKKNDAAEVTRLQHFLNAQLGLALAENGVFDRATDRAVRQFQAAHAAEVLTPWGITAPTGFVYKTTQRWINLMHCTSLAIPMPDLVPYAGE